MKVTTGSGVLPSSWLLLRGLTREVGHWGEFPARLRESLPGAEVLVCDLPGAGSEHRNACPLTIDGMLDDVRRRTLTQSPSTAPRVLVGQSLGGILSLQWWRRYPAEVHSVVLLNASVGGLSLPHQRLLWRNWPKLAWLLLEPNVAARERTILQLTSNRPELWQSMTPVWTEIARRQPMQARNIIAQLAAAACFRLPLQRSSLAALQRAPVLLLASQRDRLVDVRCSQAMHERFGWPIRLHPSAGHDLPLDEPHWVLAELIRWYQQEKS